MTSTYPETLDAIAERIGREHGTAAGSWVIDGNTSEDTAQKILDGYNDGDPAVMDMQPSPLSGEWADGLSEADVIREICERASYLRPAPVADQISEDETSDLIDAFENGYSEGYWDEVTRAAKAMLPATVRDVLAAAGYNPETSFVVGVRTYPRDSDVLYFSGAKINNRLGDDPLDIANYRALDAMPEWSEHRCGAPFWEMDHFALEMDGPAPSDLMEIIESLENYPVLDESLLSEVEMELAQEHWDDYGRRDAMAALAELVDVDADDIDNDAINALLDAHVISNDAGRYPEYQDPSSFEFHVADIAADVFAAVVAWLTAERQYVQAWLDAEHAYIHHGGLF